MPKARYKTTEEDIEIASAEYNKQAKSLTKRELYASMAMQGMSDNFPYYEPSQIAKKAVGLADALIDELENKK